MAARDLGGMMRVAIDALSAQVGGGIVYIHYLVRHLVKGDYGHQYVVFCTPENRGKLQLPEESPSLQVVDCPVQSVAHRFWFEQVNIPRLVDRMRIDVLYAPAEVAPLWGRFPVVLATRNIKPYAKIPAGSDWRARLRLRALRLLAICSSRRADAVVFVSEWGRTLVSPILHVPFEQQHVVYHGVDLPSMQEVSLSQSERGRKLKQVAGDREIVLAVSALASHKNYESLVRAMSLLPCDVQERVLLVIVGNTAGPVYGNLQALVGDLGIQDSVWFAGEVPHRELGLFYHEATVFVQPSRQETFGMTLLEAMAFGVPVICSRAGPFAEIADGAASFFDFDDVQHIADLIMEIVLNPDSASERVLLGLKRARSFSWQRTAGEMVRIFEQCRGDMPEALESCP